MIKVVKDSSLPIDVLLLKDIEDVSNEISSYLDSILSKYGQDIKIVITDNCAVKLDKKDPYMKIDDTLMYKDSGAIISPTSAYNNERNIIYVFYNVLKMNYSSYNIVDVIGMCVAHELFHAYHYSRGIRQPIIRKGRYVMEACACYFEYLWLRHKQLDKLADKVYNSWLTRRRKYGLDYLYAGALHFSRNNGEYVDLRVDYNKSINKLKRIMDECPKYCGYDTLIDKKKAPPLDITSLIWFINDKKEEYLYGYTEEQFNEQVKDVHPKYKELIKEWLNEYHKEWCSN